MYDPNLPIDHQDVDDDPREITDTVDDEDLSDYSSDR